MKYVYLNLLCYFNVCDDGHSHNEERSVIRGDNIHDDCVCVCVCWISVIVVMVMVNGITQVIQIYITENLCCIFMSRSENKFFVNIQNTSVNTCIKSRKKLCASRNLTKIFYTKKTSKCSFEIAETECRIERAITCIDPSLRCLVHMA